MGHEDLREGHFATSDIQATPLLPEEKHGSPMSSLTPPAPRATADDVRNFLVEVMLHRGADIDHARRVASRWSLGTGRELRQYPVVMYQDLFGADEGWVVYKDVKSLFYKEEREKRGILRWAGPVGLVISIALLVVSLIALCEYAYLESAALNVPLSITFAVAFWGIFGSAALIVMGRRDPEDRAERELQNCWTKQQITQGRPN